MARSTPPKLHQGMSLLDQQLNEILGWAQQVNDEPISDGELVEDIEITTGTRKVVQPGLGRDVTGYVVTKRNANAVVYDEQDDSDRPEGELWLQASANVTVSLYVF